MNYWYRCIDCGWIGRCPKVALIVTLTGYFCPVCDCEDLDEQEEPFAEALEGRDGRPAAAKETEQGEHNG